PKATSAVGKFAVQIERRAPFRRPQFPAVIAIATTVVVVLGLPRGSDAAARLHCAGWLGGGDLAAGGARAAAKCRAPRRRADERHSDRRRSAILRRCPRERARPAGMARRPKSPRRSSVERRRR